MSAAETPQRGGHENRLLYWVIGAITLALLIAGVAAYRQQKSSREANAKADELIAALRARGLNVPASKDMIVRVLGTDGGPVCADPGSALAEGQLQAQLSNGASQVGQRPVIVAPRVVLGELVVLQVYCPEHVARFREVISGYEFDDTIND